jgi:hypothetical protein
LNRRAAIGVILAVCIALSACAGGTASRPWAQYSYRPPAGVSQADAEDCSRQADSSAKRPVEGPAPATIWMCNEAGGQRGGVAIGVTGCAQWDASNLESVRQDAYERAMKECLRGRGYDIPD